MEAIALGLEAIAIRLEAIASNSVGGRRSSVGGHSLASRLEAIATTCTLFALSAVKKAAVKVCFNQKRSPHRS